jgi:hypothetical protein
MKPLPPIERLRELLTYDPLTGIFTRQSSRCSTAKKDPTRLISTGYLQIYIDGRECKAHRIAWALYHGEDPYPMELDHINRNRTDNRIANLRLATSSENKKNATHTQANRLKKKVKITYPDGRGVIVTDSITTAARLLNLKQSTLANHLHAKRGKLMWPRTNEPSGICVCYEV